MVCIILILRDSHIISAFYTFFVFCTFCDVFSNAETQTETMWPLSGDEQSTPHGPQTRIFDPISPGNIKVKHLSIRSFTCLENWYDISV